MTIGIDYTLWDADKKSIKMFKILTINEEDIIEMMMKKYQEDQLPIPINLNKDELIVEFSICGGTF